MACQELEGRNFIIENVKRIDMMQKEISTGTSDTCIGCENSLITLAYNTVPVSFWMSNGTMFQAPVSIAGSESGLFRIENVRDNRFVTLRIIQSTSTEETTASSTTSLSCSNQTCILDLACVCAMQCFSAINCTLCNTCPNG